MEKLQELIALLKTLVAIKTKQRIDIASVVITGAGDFPIERELDKRYSKLTGIALQAQSNAKLSFKKFDVNGNSEDFAAGFELAFISTDQNVSPDFRFWALDHPANGYKLEASITDDGTTAAYPYTVKLHLRLER